MADGHYQLGVDNTGFVTLFAATACPQIEVVEDNGGASIGYLVKRPPTASSNTHRPNGAATVFRPLGGRRYFAAGEAVASFELDQAGSILLDVLEG